MEERLDGIQRKYICEMDIGIGQEDTELYSSGRNKNRRIKNGSIKKSYKI